MTSAVASTPIITIGFSIGVMRLKISLVEKTLSDVQKFDVLLDNEASLIVFSNRDIFKRITPIEKPIAMIGVDATAKGVIMSEQGYVENVGPVYIIVIVIHTNYNHYHCD